LPTDDWDSNLRDKLLILVDGMLVKEFSFFPEDLDLSFCGRTDKKD
jgi:hypothetical protein